MAKDLTPGDVTVKVYHGYGHTHNCVIYGHVLAGKAKLRTRYTNNPVSNIIQLIRLFFIKPLANQQLRMNWGEQVLETKSAADGFFKFEWQSAKKILSGSHVVRVELINRNGAVDATGEGRFIVPHTTQFAFISDIDDTVLVSHSATTGKRLKVLFTKHPRSRKAFKDVVEHYHLLSLAQTESGCPNPFFYVSSSEWNLYDYLSDFFQHNGLPEGVFLLNEIKRWYQLVKTGKTKHRGKLMRVARILEAFPKQHFVLLGDNSQSDPEIYAAIANRFPENIFAIYIRKISLEKENSALAALAAIKNKAIYTLLFEDNTEAIEHSRGIGLIE